MPAADRRSSPTLAFLLGIAFTVVVTFAGLYTYLRFGHPPVAVADGPFPFEGQVVHVPLSARIDRELAKPAIEPTPANLVAGAHVYATQCLGCHGTPNQASTLAKAMYPAVPQLWKSHGHSGVVGVSDDEPGETYWKVANGIRLSGMPGFRTQLTDTEIWQVSLLLSNADKTLPPAALSILRPDSSSGRSSRVKGIPAPQSTTTLDE